MAAKRRKFALLATALQAVFVGLFFAFADHEIIIEGPSIVTVSLKSRDLDCNITANESDEMQYFGVLTTQSIQSNHLAANGPSMFQDTFFLTVSAFGLTYCHVSRHNVSSLAWSILITAFGAQWGMLCRGFFFTVVYPIRIGILSLLGSLATATTVLISWGALLGKLSPVQLVVLTFIEIPVAVLTEWLAVSVLHTNDVGGSMLCHEFGTYFGLGVSLLLYRHDFTERREKSTTDRTGSFRCLIGTLIFWCFWPTSVATPLTGSDRNRVIVNVYASMLSSCVMTFALSSAMDAEGKFNLGHIQNATIAGGVAIGTAADSMIGPGGALLVGAVGAIVTILGMTYVQPFLTKNLYVHDTLGVNNLHGLVGIVGGVIGAFVIGFSSEDVYGLELYRLYKSMVPQFNTPEFQRLNAMIPNLVPGLGRTPIEQAGFQAVTLAVCCFLPLFFGSLTGLLLRAPIWDAPIGSELYDDHTYWRLIPSMLTDNDGIDNGIKVTTAARCEELQPTSVYSVSGTPTKSVDGEAPKTNSVAPAGPVNVP